MKTPNKTIYVAGRYRAETQMGVDMNIQNALYHGMLCIEKGWMPVIPHANTPGFENLYADPHSSDEFFLAGTMLLLRPCDAILMIAGWESSTGAQEELKEARRLGKQIFTNVAAVPEIFTYDN